MKQQQPPPPAASNASPQLPFAPNAVTTEQIQKYLDENKNLILAILENQTLGKLAESQQYQAILQRNLMYLAAIADAQSPQNSTTAPSQLTPNSAPQQGNHPQKPQTPIHQQQQQHGGVPAAKLPFQLNTMQSQEQLQQHQQQQQQQQQLMQMRAAQQQQQQQQLQGQSGQMMHQNMQQHGHHSNLGNFMGGGGGGGYNSVEANNSSDGQGK